MKIKISQIIDVDVPDNATEDETYDLINNFFSSVNRKNLDFVIESVDDDSDHPLVDEIVGN